MLLALAAFAVGLLLKAPLGIDFHTYAAAARTGLQYGWGQIYDQRLVDLAQARLAPQLAVQPYLSPPPVAWLVAPTLLLPFAWAYALWALLSLAALALAVAWTAPPSWRLRTLAVAVAVAPWWVAQALHVGQVTPLLAAALIVGWRLLGQERAVLAGLALAVLALKPNTALLVGPALLVAGQRRSLAAGALAVSALTILSLVAVGGPGLRSYSEQLLHPPSGASALTLEGAFGIQGATALLARGVVVGACLVLARRLRAHPGLVLAVAILGSLLISSYLHASDLCLLLAAAWLVWNEAPLPVVRASIAAGWLLASPIALALGLSPDLNRWPALELGALLALALLVRGPDARRRLRAPAELWPPLPAAVVEQVEP
ncbi:MAG TPA: glycosyltransferase family 87 protein [Candidatus Nitrosotalea sp.]|nr:glycosyltransferase family 87 protein [Candidatus Nitrosotalea sp.]